MGLKAFENLRSNMSYVYVRYVKYSQQKKNAKEKKMFSNVMLVSWSINVFLISFLNADENNLSITEDKMLKFKIYKAALKISQVISRNNFSSFFWVYHLWKKYTFDVNS